MHVPFVLLSLVRQWEKGASDSCLSCCGTAASPLFQEPLVHWRRGEKKNWNLLFLHISHLCVSDHQTKDSLSKYKREFLNDDIKPSWAYVKHNSSKLVPQPVAELLLLQQ